MKLRAFTILELMVTILISSLTIAFTMAVLNVVIKMHTNFKVNSEVVAQLEELRFLIIEDAEKALEISAKNNSFIFVNASNTIEYFYSTTYLVRIQENKQDTFFLDELLVSTVLFDPTKNVISEIYITSAINETEYNCSIFKNYDALTKQKLMNGNSY